MPVFLSSRPNWLPPPPHPQASVDPPPLLVPKGATHLLEEKRGLVEPIRTKGQILWYSGYRIWVTGYIIPDFVHLLTCTAQSFFLYMEC